MIEWFNMRYSWRCVFGSCHGGGTLALKRWRITFMGPRSWRFGIMIYGRFNGFIAFSFSTVCKSLIRSSGTRTKTYPLGTLSTILLLPLISSFCSYPLLTLLLLLFCFRKTTWVWKESKYGASRNWSMKNFAKMRYHFFTVLSFIFLTFLTIFCRTTWSSCWLLIMIQALINWQWIKPFSFPILLPFNHRFLHLVVIGSVFLHFVSIWYGTHQIHNP